MKTLLILRHAKSSWQQPELSDHDRPLNKRGLNDAPRMGKLLYDEDLLPDLILSSSAVRAKKTAELVIESSGYTGEFQVRRDLYAHNSEAYLMILSEMDNIYKSIMIVGHNPGLEELIYALTGEWHRMPTASLAKVALPIDDWGLLDDETDGVLVNLWRPKELP